VRDLVQPQHKENVRNKIMHKRLRTNLFKTICACKKSKNNKRFFSMYFAELWAYRLKYNENLIYFNKHKGRVTTFNTTYISAICIGKQNQNEKYRFRKNDIE
jgi:hypothetical protein